MLQSEFGDVAEVDDVVLFLSEDIVDTKMKMSPPFLEGSERSYFNGIHFVLNYSKIGSVNTGNILFTNSRKDSFSRVIS